MEQVTTNPSEITSSPRSNDPSEIERWASLIGGGALILMGIQQRSLRGILTTIAGGGLIYQGITNQSTIEQAKEALGVDQAIKVEKTVTIRRPAEDLYNFWRNFENLPTFMEHLQFVKVYNETRSHWIATAPLQNVEWDAEIIKDEPHHLIAWTSVEGAEINHSGFIRFQNATGGRGTEVKVVMEYLPPGGAIANLISKIFGESPEQQIGDDLSRFKQLMEAGEIATIEGQSRCA
ncbi:MAG: SRPBCC family protein [Snowella sp.]|nr:SRPBCC family protein [Snowella sp.]